MDEYQRYRKLILHILKPAKQEAEDLLQDTFLSFLENYKNITDEIEIKKILCTIARNKLKDFFKEVRHVSNYYKEQ